MSHRYKHIAAASYTTSSPSVSTGISPFGFNCKYAVIFCAFCVRSTSRNSNGKPNSRSKICGAMEAVLGE